MYRPGYGGENKCQNVKVGSKVATFLKKNQNVTLHLGTDGCHEKGFSGGIYVDVILVHIKTRLDLLGIQTFRWDQRLGRQYSNLNRHVSTQEKQSQRQFSAPSSMVL